MSWRDFNPRRGLTFQAKVLVPVIGLVVLFPVLMLFINQRSGMQYLTREAHQQLRAADAVFGNSLALRARQAVARYKNLASDPRFKAIAQTGDSATMTDHLEERLEEPLEEADVLMFIGEHAETLAFAERDGQLKIAAFERAALPAARQALAGQATHMVIPVDAAVFDVVAVPVVVNKIPLGSLLVGQRMGVETVRELTALIRGEGVFIANRNIAASTLLRSDLRAAALPRLEKGSNAGSRIEKLVINGVHYLALASAFRAAPENADAGYVLLVSYEDSLQQLRRTQAMLWLLSLLGVSVSTMVIWVVIGKITAPLRELRAMAEAVGKGDFTAKVKVESSDEFGQLGQAFNQMARNLRGSHEALRRAVDTLKTTQAQLIQSEKLSAVGEFVAGVAHELNNPLTSVIGFAELLKEANLHPKHQSYLLYIVKSTERCHRIVQGLLSFARQHPPERRLLNINELIETVLDILAYELRTSNIEVQRDFQKEPPKMMGDSHQLQQVVLNILNNARQAIEARQPSGRIRITTESSSDKVRIIIDDNGPGIPKENLAKIFNPFFTTKPVGKGTGLGLSLCYGIVREHGGNISVHSEMGKGATFIIELPAGGPEQPDGSPAAPAEASQRGAGKRVLVIDDEEWILELVRQILKQDGFEVDTAQDGQSALQQVAQNRYELLMCDWKMPGLSGPRLYERISSISSEAAQRLVFMTGDVVNESFQRFLKEHSKACLSKPFSVQELRRTINAMVG